MCLLRKLSLKAQAQLPCTDLSFLTLNFFQIGILELPQERGAEQNRLGWLLSEFGLAPWREVSSSQALVTNKTGTLMRESRGWWEAESPLTQAGGQVRLPLKNHG